MTTHFPDTVSDPPSHEPIQRTAHTRCLHSHLQVTPKASKGPTAAVQMQSLKTPVSSTRTRSLSAAARESTPSVDAEEEQATPKTRKTRLTRV